MLDAETSRPASLAAVQRYVDAWLAGGFPAMLAITDCP